MADDHPPRTSRVSGWLRAIRAKLAGLRERFLRRRDFLRQIRPETFRELAREMLELAGFAERLWPRDHAFQERLRRIQEEMAEVEKLTGRPEFRRLSEAQRLRLRESILKSREQLMETVQNAPTPTTYLQ